MGLWVWGWMMRMGMESNKNQRQVSKGRKNRNLILVVISSQNLENTNQQTLKVKTTSLKMILGSIFWMKLET